MRYSPTSFHCANRSHGCLVQVLWSWPGPALPDTARLRDCTIRVVKVRAPIANVHARGKCLEAGSGVSRDPSLALKRVLPQAGGCRKRVPGTRPSPPFRGLLPPHAALLKGPPQPPKAERPHLDASAAATARQPLSLRRLRSWCRRPLPFQRVHLNRCAQISSDAIRLYQSARP